MAVFDLVRVEVLRQLAHGRTAEGAFERTPTAMAEVPNDAAVVVIRLLAKLIEPLVNEWRKAPLLSADCGVCAGIHGCRQ